MRILVAGGTGAIGRRLVPRLVQEGYQVTGITRSQSKVSGMLAAGAAPLIADALQRDEVRRAVEQAQPDVIIHELTAIPQEFDIRRFREQFHLTARLRTEGMDQLLDAAKALGVRRFIAQSYAGWPYGRSGAGLKTETDPLDPHPPEAMLETLHAIQHLESAVSHASYLEGIVLRYGPLYGPGNALGEGGSMVDMIRKRRLPVIGGGTGVWSFLHIDDAARATVLAVKNGKPGVYNIVDDDPAPVSEWLPTLAQLLHAKTPFRLPGWIGRLVVGEAGMLMMTGVRGVSNQKAKRELGWQPRWKSWREGFRYALGETSQDSTLGASSPQPRRAVTTSS
jgi:nucleoside-diphosphate-sugar epimerase